MWPATSVPPVVAIRTDAAYCYGSLESKGCSSYTPLESHGGPIYCSDPIILNQTSRANFGDFDDPQITFFVSQVSALAEKYGQAAASWPLFFSA